MKLEGYGCRLTVSTNRRLLKRSREKGNPMPNGQVNESGNKGDYLLTGDRVILYRDCRLVGQERWVLGPRAEGCPYATT